MATENLDSATLKVSAHVLIQLGEELVTDKEQAILECVKNAYDADSPNCTILIDTKAQGEITQKDRAIKFKGFTESSENVEIFFRNENGEKIFCPNGQFPESIQDETIVLRVMKWRGSITIQDNGDGISPEKIKTSWLVISNSFKRQSEGAKSKTKLGRTPLGDKGVGRLGSMKLGDILRVESAIHSEQLLAAATFRWSDCKAAQTIDQIPVIFEDKIPNSQKFKGTRVQVLGITDQSDWDGTSKGLEIAQSLAKLISPFEAKSNFPVFIEVDNHKTNLVSVTNTLLSRAVAVYKFKWTEKTENEPTLFCEAVITDRLFTAKENKNTLSQSKTESSDEKFFEWLKTYKKLKMFNITPKPVEGQFLKIAERKTWSEIVPSDNKDISLPGDFTGEFYYFFVQKLNDTEDQIDEETEINKEAVIGFNRGIIKDMAGVSILRDGFKVRSQGDWLGISSGATSGGMFQLRFENTVGFFALSGEHNFSLIEKSDREGFVENSAFKGFKVIAEACKTFANKAQDGIRRAKNEFYKDFESSNTHRNFPTPISMIQDSVDSTLQIHNNLEQLVSELSDGVKFLGSSKDSNESQLFSKLNIALESAKATRANLPKISWQKKAVELLKQDQIDTKERMFALYESAAVGLSARGLAHDLRTHIVEIRRRLTTIKKIKDTGDISPHLIAIQTSCASIASAAALIDPMLPRTRTIKETINLREFITEYFENRAYGLQNEKVEFKFIRSDYNTTVRINRGRLLQVFDNLVRNSIYWLGRGKNINKIETEKKINVRITNDGFVIQDTGPGVNTKFEESLFEMFVTAKPSPDTGQGLGLFICTQLLEIDGCSISLLGDRNSFGNRYKFHVNLGSVIVKE